MRLFIALNLPHDLRREVYEAAGPLREEDYPVRWMEPEQYHVTLKFLGEVEPDRVPEIRGALAEVAGSMGPFPVQLQGFGAFPTIRRPRVLWLGVDPSPALRCLKQDLEWALAELGFERETRAFHPHVTLGRSRSDRAGAFRGLDDLSAGLDYTQECDVTSVELMRSRLSASGATYSVTGSADLEPEAGE